MISQDENRYIEKRIREYMEILEEEFEFIENSINIWEAHNKKCKGYSCLHCFGEKLYEKKDEIKRRIIDEQNKLNRLQKGE